jgi:hypothetical protein
MDPFEKELKGLKPRDPSPLLKERIAQQLGGADEPRVSHAAPNVIPFRWGWLYAAAAVLLLALGWGVFRTYLQDPDQAPVRVASKPLEPTSLYHPVSAERHLLGKSDEGIVVLNGYGPVRKTSYHTVDHMVWENPRNGRRYSVTRPSAQVMLTRMDVR